MSVLIIWSRLMTMALLHWIHLFIGQSIRVVYVKIQDTLYEGLAAQQLRQYPRKFNREIRVSNEMRAWNEIWF